MSTNKVPQLRFKGFSGEWEEKKLKDVSTYSNGGSFENDVKEMGKYELITLKSVDMGGNLVSSGKYIDIETLTLVKDTLVMILSEQSLGLIGMTAKIHKNNTYVLNQRVAEIRPNQDINSYFLSMVINTNQQYFSSRGAGTKVQNISKPNVENYEFFCPLLDEQTKIGNYFQNLDKLIEQKEKKYQKLGQLKKAMLEKMFVKDGKKIPEIRFKGCRGEWEEKELGEVVEVVMGQSPSSMSYNTNKNGIPLIQGNADIQNRLSSPRNWTTETTKECKVGDLILTVRAPVGAVAKAVHNACIGRGVCAIRNNIKSSNEFIYQFLLDYETKWSILEQGSTFTAVSGAEIKKININIPSRDEQTKIGIYFQKLDHLIELQLQELKKLKNIKKASLEKMFV